MSDPDTGDALRETGDELPGKEVLYLLRELMSEAEQERRLSALAREKLDVLEIDSIFRRSRKVRKKADPGEERKERFEDLLNLSDPPIPAENARALKEIADTGSLAELEDAVAKERITVRQAGEMWGGSLGFAYVNPLESIVTPEAAALLPEEIARKAEVIPLYVMENVLTMASSRPEDEEQNRRIANIAGMKCSPVFALPSQIRSAHDLYYGAIDDIDAHIEAFEREHGYVLIDLEDAPLQNLAESRPVAKIVDALLHWAIRERASDIHLEPAEASSRVRFRIDGRLRLVLTVSRSIYPAIISRIKVLTNVNIAESRFPQDGRFTIPLGTGKAEFRVSFLPTRHGTKTVIRILGGAGRGRMITLDEMLISQSILKPWRRVIRNPNGIIFVTGPTGSGKTTTLYATLQELNTPDVNISTIEDPIEIELEGLNQSQVNAYIDLSFAIILRALLRQDPNILLVGEIRDKETAKIATEAALTGHLVFSTLHTNNAIQAVVRLLEIGIEPYMVAPSINAVMAQRLASRLNDDFKESYRPPPDVLRHFFSDYEEVEDALFYRPSPRLENRNLAYQGRVAIHELVLVSDTMRSLIAANAGTRELSEAARALGFRPLRYDGLKKALMGLTTLEEIERVTPLEWSE